MESKEVREKYLKFFEKRGHKRITPAPLVLENDPTTLFTSSGMQPLVPYLMGEPHPEGKRLVDSQPSIRLQDIDEVGDNRHITFFEMLGNWSLGDYFKKEQLLWIFEFLTEDLGLPKDKIWTSVFEGNKDVPRDEESFGIWKSLGIPEKRICFYGVKKNWWSRSGTPDQMPVGEIGGPDSEIFFDFGRERKLHENSPFRNEKCHPNCDCGRFLEIGNSVFMQYKKVGEGKLEELPQKSVDFGGGLERITAAFNGDPDIFKIDMFMPLIDFISNQVKVKYDNKSNSSYRIISDHIRASVFLIRDGVRPGNKLQEYVLRRLLRRAISKMYLIEPKFDSKDFKLLVGKAIDAYSGFFKGTDKKDIGDVVSLEVRKFRGTVERGFKEIEKQTAITGKTAFDLYQSYGFPLELTEEIARDRGQEVDRAIFKEEFEKHKQNSRTTSAGVFKGGLADHSPEVVRLHTATHLLLASLRKVLGDHVVQKGQNITKERSRFDFPNPEKLTDSQLNEVENLINSITAQKLPVSFVVMPKDEALITGAIHAFNEKYADTVKVYFVGKSFDEAVSKEFCGGPHVVNTAEIGRVKIIKQEKIGAGLIRIYLVIS